MLDLNSKTSSIQSRRPKVLPYWASANPALVKTGAGFDPTLGNRIFSIGFSLLPPPKILFFLMSA